MASRKEYEMLFQLNAQLGGSYSKTFRAAQQEITAMQKEIQSLSKTQADITAYQKQQAAVENTQKRLEMLQKQYDNIQKEIQQTGEFSADLQNKLLAKQQQIDKTSSSLSKQTQKLNEMGDALREAGVDMDDLGRSSTQLSSRIDALKQDQEEAAEKAQTFGDKAGQAFGAVHEAIVAAGIATALKEVYEYFASCAQASMDFESAMTGVAKTTDFTDEELTAMSESIQEMSTEIPATTDELAGIAEAAGQLGIHKESLLDFTEIMAMLGTATNMTADEAATSLSRLANITGMSQEDFDRLGATIVDLGNNLATTEKEIVDMSLRIAGAGAQVGMTEAEIMSFSGALSSVGIEAEAGGSAFSTLISNMSLAVQQGGDELAQFADVAGMSAGEFAAAFEDDAAAAIIQFIQGLSAMDAQGRSAIAVLDEMGLSDIRMRDALLRAAGASDTFTNALQIGSSAWEANTALTTEATKRYATTQSQLTMMQNSYKNLKTVIGDAYNPALLEAYSIGTKVLNGVTDFVKQNPELVNAVTAFVGVMGAATAGLAAYAAITKIVIPLMKLFTASIPGVNIIMGVAVAVGAITAGIAALATAAANDAVPSVSELTEAARGMRDAMDEANTMFESTAAQTAANAEVADQYIAKLEEMGDYTRLSKEEQEEYRNTLSLLCELMPELSSLIDVQNGAINGGTDALRANTEAWKKNAEAQAYQEYMNQLAEQYNSVMVEAAENRIRLTQAEVKADAATEGMEETYRALLNSLRMTDAEFKQHYGTVEDIPYRSVSDEVAELRAKYLDFANQQKENTEIAHVHQKAIEEDIEAVSAAKEAMELGQEAVENLNAAMQENSGETAEAAEQKEVLQSTVVGTMEKVNELATAYDEAYKAAFDSISGQYQLWDEAAEIVATSAGTINSALESQVSYWETYNANLQSLTERSADIEGLSEMIASFADGSEDSVNTIAGMAGATDEQLATMVSNWQILQDEQKKAAGSVADLKTDFTAAMDELQTELAANIEAMDLGEEAIASGQATIQGFIDGASGMLPQVSAAYTRIGLAAQNALKLSADALSIHGYAVGTQSAEEGFALVGENGPELVYFNGGEQVMTAEETAALQDSLSLEAAMFSPQLMAAMGASHNNAVSAEWGDPGGGSTVLYFSPQYDLSGVSNAAELEAVLAAHDEDMRELILQVLEEAGVDAVRRSYT